MRRRRNQKSDIKMNPTFAILRRDKQDKLSKTLTLVQISSHHK
jgi:hypothetical protein